MHLPVILRASLVAAALACAALLALPARASETPPPSLSLTGTGEIRVAPDMAVVTTGVVTEADTARAALDANNEAVAAVIAAIKEAGIAPADIQTSGFRVEPRYRPGKRGEEPAPPRIVGYTVMNGVAIQVRDLGKLGAVLDKVVSVGANRVSGIDFLVSEADRRLDEARALAMKDAIRKAELYAGAAGVRLERILSISESGGFVPMPRRAEMMRADAVAAAVPVEAGEQALRVDVHVTWQIGQ